MTLVLSAVGPRSENGRNGHELENFLFELCRMGFYPNNDYASLSLHYLNRLQLEIRDRINVQ